MEEPTEELKESEEIVEATEEAPEADKEEETVEVAEEKEEVPVEEELTEEAVEEVEEIEEKKEVKKAKEKEIEEIVEEKIYTIPLGRAWISPRKKRAPKAIRLIKSFIQRHMKIKTEVEEMEEEAERLVISNEVNEKIWSRGIEKPPRKIRVRAAKDKEGVITVYLAEG
jgi:large subunit ribosomal protein L31e